MWQKNFIADFMKGHFIALVCMFFVIQKMQKIGCYKQCAKYKNKHFLFTISSNNAKWKVQNKKHEKIEIKWEKRSKDGNCIEEK